MKEWMEPKMNILGLGSTEAGKGPIAKPDDHYVDDNGDEWWSFPS